ncbi:lytic polysaccharide monooxygenase auxiliary activity family 9 protein [Nocardia sp. NPDC052316]|uniref:lytic polysaccharide monooxygenase auxiliary activity family 9 protein n=1 Tax=Nocardia sp. NPDC052316 TaxID=3364329 RepID=UPI0037C688A2
MTAASLTRALQQRMLSVVAAATIAPFIVAALHAAPADAYGYLSAPASRQVQCAQSLLPCGPVKYEPQNVQGPPGQRSCSGGDGRWADLDDDSKPWQVHHTSGTVTFTWTLTALHRTQSYEYWIGDTRVAVIDGKNQPPSGRTVTHTVQLGTFTGPQKLIGIWNVADTSSAFYSCVDLHIGSGTVTPVGIKGVSKKRAQIVA